MLRGWFLFAVFLLVSTGASAPALATPRKHCLLVALSSERDPRPEYKEWIRKNGDLVTLNGVPYDLPRTFVEIESISMPEKAPQGTGEKGMKLIVVQDKDGNVVQREPFPVIDPVFDPYVMGPTDEKTPFPEKKHSSGFKMDLKDFSVQNFLSQRYEELLRQYPRMDIPLNNYVLQLLKGGALDHHTLTLIGVGGSSRSYARHTIPELAVPGDPKNALQLATDVAKVRRLRGDPKNMANDFIVDLLIADLAAELARRTSVYGKPLLVVDPLKVTPESFKAGVAFQTALTGEDYYSIAFRLGLIEKQGFLTEADRNYLASIGAKNPRALRTEIQDLEYFFWITQTEIIQWVSDHLEMVRSNALHSHIGSSDTHVEIGLDMNHGHNLIRTRSGVTHLLDP